MSTLVVLPSIVPEITRGCIDTMRFVDPTRVPDLSDDPGGPGIASIVANRPDTRLVVVYNTPKHNLGVAGSWNVGIRQMRDYDLDWLVICSAAVRFGPPGGNDFLDAIERMTDPLWAPHGILAAEGRGGLGWHLIAFHRDVFDRVGTFDENYWPAYHEDNDMSYRIQLAYEVDSRAPGFVGPLWPKVPAEATLLEVAHGIKRSGVQVDLVKLESYYVAKWGGKSTQEWFTHPFHVEEHAVGWWPKKGERP